MMKTFANNLCSFKFLNSECACIHEKIQQSMHMYMLLCLCYWILIIFNYINSSQFVLVMLIVQNLCEQTPSEIISISTKKQKYANLVNSEGVQ